MTQWKGVAPKQENLRWCADCDLLDLDVRCLPSYVETSSNQPYQSSHPDLWVWPFPLSCSTAMNKETGCGLINSSPRSLIYQVLRGSFVCMCVCTLMWGNLPGWIRMHPSLLLTGWLAQAEMLRHALSMESRFSEGWPFSLVSDTTWGACIKF